MNRKMNYLGFVTNTLWPVFDIHGMSRTIYLTTFLQVLERAVVINMNVLNAERNWPLHDLPALALALAGAARVCAGSVVGWVGGG